MSTADAAPNRPHWLMFAAAKHRGAIVAAAVLIALFVLIDMLSAGPFSYFEFSFMSSGGATLALAAMGQTFVILTGGFDLSAGAVISLVNVVLASAMGQSIASQVGFGGLALLIGAGVGAFNGFFVAFMRLQPIVVTLSTMFIVQGITLLIMSRPGGSIPFEFSQFFVGDAIPGVLPAPVVVLLVAVAAWLLIKNTRFGLSLYAVGSDEESARANGVAVHWTKFFAYVVAGVFYGAAGAFISAQTGSADPLIGKPLLLPIFAAVVIGGTVLGGGRGGAIGSLFGAYILTIVVSILLILNVSAYYSSVAEGLILILAVLAASMNRASPIGRYLRMMRLKWQARRERRRASDHVPLSAGPGLDFVFRNQPAVPGLDVSWLERHRESLRLIVPAWVCLILALIATEVVFGGRVTSSSYWNSLVVLASFLSILALGQGAVILTGGLDLSIPWTIALAGIVVAGLVQGSDQVALYAIPLGLLIGVAVGMFNASGVVFLGLSPIVMTLATNGIVQGLALVYSDGTPAGFASPAMRYFMTGRFLGLTPVTWFMIGFVVFALLLLARTRFGRHVYAVGNGRLVSQLSGVGVGRTLFGVYMLSGFCAALAGILLASFSGQASLGMGDDYLLPSIAVVVVGGALITGGRGHYLGMLGGVLLLTVISILLAGTTLPHAVRDIIYGLVVLGAVLALRERST
jgi:ribose transport system permease protein